VKEQTREILTPLIECFSASKLGIQFTNIQGLRAVPGTILQLHALQIFLFMAYTHSKCPIPFPKRRYSLHEKFNVCLTASVISVHKTTATFMFKVL
jgi:hypothetical protein